MPSLYTPLRVVPCPLQRYATILAQRELIVSSPAVTDAAASIYGIATSSQPPPSAAVCIPAGLLSPMEVHRTPRDRAPPPLALAIQPATATPVPAQSAAPGALSLLPPPAVPAPTTGAGAAINAGEAGGPSEDLVFTDLSNSPLLPPPPPPPLDSPSLSVPHRLAPMPTAPPPPPLAVSTLTTALTTERSAIVTLSAQDTAVASGASTGQQQQQPQCELPGHGRVSEVVTRALADRPPPAPSSSPPPPKETTPTPARPSAPSPTASPAQQQPQRPNTCSPAPPPEGHGSTEVAAASSAVSGGRLRDPPLSSVPLTATPLASPASAPTAAPGIAPATPPPIAPAAATAPPSNRAGDASGGSGDDDDGVDGDAVPDFGDALNAVLAEACASYLGVLRAVARDAISVLASGSQPRGGADVPSGAAGGAAGTAGGTGERSEGGECHLAGDSRATCDSRLCVV